MVTMAPIDIQQLAEEALNAAIKHIQDRLEIPTGDAAGIFFAGDAGDEIRRAFASYINHEAPELEGQQIKHARFDRFTIAMTLDQAQSGSHQGSCDDDVKHLMTVPAIRAQLEALDTDQLRQELREYGAWDERQLSDREDNEQRIVWLACGNIVDDNR